MTTALMPTQSEPIVHPSVAPRARFDRRHDLDALRAIAMLLGIVLHASLSFAPIPWTVSDTHRSNFYYVLFAVIHGFRMPLFFMLSGFFTAMLWRKRGLASLFKQRFTRIFLPLAIGCVTIVPMMWGVTFLVMQPPEANPQEQEIWDAMASGDTDRFRTSLEKHPTFDINSLNSQYGVSLLTTATFLGHDDAVRLLIERGADVNHQNRDQGTALHSAAYMGRSRVAFQLMAAGANPDIRDENARTAKDLLKTDYVSTRAFAMQYGASLDRNEFLAGRKEIATRLGVAEYFGSHPNDQRSSDSQGLMTLLFHFPAFMHLWFLWFLCWLLLVFLAYVLIAKALRIATLAEWLTCSPLALLWLIPTTMLPQVFMNPDVFGPDTSIGLLPIPSVLAYYGVFFFFGAIYWDADDTTGQLGRWWYIHLLVALLIVFPIALDCLSGTFGVVPAIKNKALRICVGNILEATYAWLMVLGSIGLFRSLLSHESKWLRYISDSSYWLYLVHLPLILLAQWWVRSWPIPAFIKFAGITIVVSSFLLFTYEYGVRYTAIGRLLNGPRRRIPHLAIRKRAHTQVDFAEQGAE